MYSQLLPAITPHAGPLFLTPNTHTHTHTNAHRFLISVNTCIYRYASRILFCWVCIYEGNEDGDGFLAAKKREDFSEKINLDLGIGSCACANEGGLKRNKKIKQENKESLFTALQFHEFYNQILVYNSIASGLPLPFHLFLPIWTSVFNSFGPAIYKKYPSCEYSF